MQLLIADVLTPAELVQARRQIDDAQFVDGRSTAGWAARHVKNNEQASVADPIAATLKNWLAERILAQPVFNLAARPKALSPLLLSRYRHGQHYGTHVDDALMQGLRSDVSFTLFLTDPADYAGGELILESASGEIDYKPAAGSLLAYPSTHLHRVAPVTEGTRLAAVGWARSFIRDAGRRELLFDLDTARRRLFDQHGKTAEFDLLSKCAANLMRAWADD